MSLLAGLAAFIAATLAARFYRTKTGRWVPGWIGGISLVGLFAVFFMAAVASGGPAWLETAFFVVVGLHVGAFVALSANPPHR